MRKLFFTTGIAGEPLQWLLQSSSAENGVTKSVYEATSRFFHRTYHLVTVSGKDIDAQHLSFR